MKLLFDQNISFRVVKHIQSVFTEAKHVNDCNLQNSSDRSIWNFARENGYSIITFDADYYDLVTLKGHPPKIIWLRTGNTSTSNLTKILQHHSEVIRSFVMDDNYKSISCLEIY